MTGRATGTHGTFLDGAIVPDDEPLASHQRVLGALRSQPGKLYAVLDAARDPEVLTMLRCSGHRYQSLYEGARGELYAAAAPYLVRLRKGSPFLERLVEKGWGNAWGVYLTSDEGFERVRRHLRRRLQAELEGVEGTVLFRYYDPRVVQGFLSVCLPSEASALLDPFLAVIAEDPATDSLTGYSAASGRRDLGAARDATARGW